MPTQKRTKTTEVRFSRAELLTTLGTPATDRGTFRIHYEAKYPETVGYDLVAVTGFTVVWTEDVEC